MSGGRAAVDPALAWRAFACMASVDAPDGAPSFMLYGGTNATDAGNPLAVAGRGLNVLQIYNVDTDTWYLPGAANAPGEAPVLPGCGAASSTAWVYDPQYGTTGNASTTVRVLDTVHWSWSTPMQSGQLPVTRFGAAFAYVPDRQAFYMHGGIPLSAATNTADSPPGIANNMDYLNPPALSWSYASNGPARKYHTLCYMSSIKSLVLFGGSDQNIGSYNDVKVFSVERSAWEYAVNVQGGAPAERILHSAVCTEDAMYVFGGLHNIGDAPSDSAVWVLTASNATSFTWTRAPIPGPSQGAGPAARAGHSAALLNNNMYIFGGVGPSARDSAMYRLDLKSWQWTASNADGSRPSDDGGVNTRVLVAAVVASVLGLICVGIAGFAYYRWNRRRGVSAHCVASPSEGASESHDGARAPPDGPSQRDKADSGGYFACDEYQGPLFSRSGGTAVDGMGADDPAMNNYLPPSHANPSLGSSPGTFSPLTSASRSPRGAGVGETSGSSDSMAPAQSSDGGVSGGVCPGEAVSMDMLSPPAAPDHRQLVGAIIASGQPIPAWLREAASRRTDEQANGKIAESEDASGLADDSAGSGRGSSLMTSADQGPAAYLLAPTSLGDDAGAGAARPTSGWRRRGSGTSDVDIGECVLPDAMPFGVSYLEDIAQPMAPPIPPRMTALYGQLESSGIVVGRAGAPGVPAAVDDHAATATGSRGTHSPATGCMSDAARSDRSSEVSILSPLDRLARYHGQDDWMTLDPAAAEALLVKRGGSETDDTSEIYPARPVRRSVDGGP
ncbi:hypothetical protein LPJ61_003948 [Coemansia biformis]|uniref:Galactose oxidase n=1 Tax=Coemansia biformis TaxID=1286918 RepID=A0A9W7YA97_9FUNG|nr:hypothetical protein LPJ61_003948 [Coemansia biformis]